VKCTLRRRLSTAKGRLLHLALHERIERGESRVKGETPAVSSLRKRCYKIKHLGIKNDEERVVNQGRQLRTKWRRKELGLKKEGAGGEKKVIS